jgi:hypothetical protein
VVRRERDFALLCCERGAVDGEHVGRLLRSVGDLFEENEPTVIATRPLDQYQICKLSGESSSVRLVLSLGT